jgi:hypothetical protein
MPLTVETKRIIKAFSISIVFMTIIATLSGCGTYFIFKSFFGGFILAFVIQILGGYIWNTYLERRERKFAETLSNELDTQIGKMTTPFELSCAYCNVINKIAYSLEDTTYFKCVSCNQPNKIFVQFTTTRVTTPITNSVTGEIDMEQEPKDNIRQTTVNEPIQVTNG